MRLFIAVLMAAALGGSSPFSQAHESQTGEDYTKHRQRNGMSCCSGHDCRPTRYEVKSDGTLVMFPEGRAVFVPGDRVTQDPSNDGLGHWCGVLHGDGNATTFCAILPLQAASKDTPAGLALTAASAQVLGAVDP